MAATTQPSPPGVAHGETRRASTPRPGARSLPRPPPPPASTPTRAPGGRWPRRWRLLSVLISPAVAGRLTRGDNTVERPQDHPCPGPGNPRPNRRSPPGSTELGAPHSPTPARLRSAPPQRRRRRRSHQAAARAAVTTDLPGVVVTMARDPQTRCLRTSRLAQVPIRARPCLLHWAVARAPTALAPCAVGSECPETLSRTVVAHTSF